MEKVTPPPPATQTTGTLYWYMTPGIVAESALAGNLQSEYVFFNGERVARRDFNPSTGAATGVFYYFSDHLKTASVTTDASGTPKAESDYYPWGGELQFVNNDSNHYKFTGKERDESGLDYFGARYYSNGLGRFITPDWAAKATAVPYAEFSDPQSLNLYGYVRNIPTTKYDADGHCPGDDCSNVKVEVKVTSPATIVKNEKTHDGYITGVRANVQYTIKENGKPVANTDVHESNTNKVTLNGEPRQPKLDQQNATTNSKGQVNDTYGLVAPSDKPLPKADANGLADTLSNNSVTQSGTQTLTFTTPTGQNCSCTVDRTLTNENKDGTNNGSNYTFTTSKPSAVKPVEQPKEKQPQ